MLFKPLPRQQAEHLPGFDKNKNEGKNIEEIAQAERNPARKDPEKARNDAVEAQAIEFFHRARKEGKNPDENGNSE